MFNVSKTGDWGRLEKTAQNLSKGNFAVKFKLTLDKDGELIKQRLLGHINAQDLGWTPLDEKTVRMKGSSKAYVETGTLKEGIEVTKATTGSGYTVYISPAKNATTHGGRNLAEVIMYLEYGTRDIPARPLIRPTWEEVKPLIKSEMRKLLIDTMRG